MFLALSELPLFFSLKFSCAFLIRAPIIDPGDQCSVVAALGRWMSICAWPGTLNFPVPQAPLHAAEWSSCMSLLRRGLGPCCAHNAYGFLPLHCWEGAPRAPVGAESHAGLPRV
jgi:hypothetical protein